MEFRWLTTEEQKVRTVESSTVSDVLALAQRLQAEGEGQFSEEQVEEMGRELGVRPEYVREALRLRRGSLRKAAPHRLEDSPMPAVASPRAAILRAAWIGLGVGTFPIALEALTRTNAGSVALLALAASLAAGWSVRYTWLAGKAGALAAPAVLIAAAHYTLFGPNDTAVLFSLLSFPPLGAALASAAARLRQSIESHAERSPLSTEHR